MYKINRTKYACGILEEIRKMNETRNYSALAGHVETLQMMYQDMEDALGIQSEFKALEESRKKANSLVKKYNKEIEKNKPNMEKVKEILDEMRRL